MGFKDSPNALRILEMLLVTSVAFAGPIYISFYYFVTGLGVAANAGQLVYTLITEFVGISVLVYVLFRQGRRLADLGFGFDWRDIFRSLAIATVGYMTFCVAYYAIYYGCYMVTGTTLVARKVGDLVFGASFPWSALALVLVNPFFEELIVRAYVMTEVQFLTGRASIAVAASVGLQTLYHLYQGTLLAVAEAALFLVFALYFSRYRRIMPVVLAHMIFDMLSLCYYAIAGAN